MKRILPVGRQTAQNPLGLCSDAETHDKNTLWGIRNFEHERTEHEFEIVGTASNSRDTLRLFHEFEPGVAIVSIDLQDGPGIGLEVIAQVHAKNFPTRTVVLLDCSDRQLVVAAFRNGARGVFFREQPYEMFPKCLRTVLQGQVWVNTTEMNYLLEALTSPQSLHLIDGNGKSVLTPRESEVAQLVTEGLSNREIAAKLDLSEHTIKNYMFRIFDKTGVSSRVALVLYTMSRQDHTHRTPRPNAGNNGHFAELAVFIASVLHLESFAGF